MQHGGSADNCHRDKHRSCGNDMHHVSLGLQVGKDVNAELLKSSLSEAGVKLDHLREVDGPSGTAVILVQPSGRWWCSLAEHIDTVLQLGCGRKVDK